MRNFFGGEFWGRWKTGWLLIIFSFASGLLLAQQSKDFEAEVFVHEVQNSKDIMYENVLEMYDREFVKNPSVYTFIEKCRFIDQVFYNEDEYYNPKYEDFEVCLGSLIARFPEEPDALIYYHYNQYDDKAVKVIETIIEGVGEGTITGSPKYLYLGYEKLAYHYSNEENHGLSIAYAKDAMKASDSLDLSVLISRQYLEIDNKEAALSFLQNNIDTIKTDQFYTKASLLKELEDYETALKMYEWLDENDWEVADDLGEIHTKLGNFDRARPYLIEASEGEWGKRKALERLYDFDLQNSPTDTLLKTYEAMRGEGFLADPFGVFKLRMLKYRGTYKPALNDVLFIVSYAALLLVVIIIPYLWVLPIYSYGKYKNVGSTDVIVFDERWGIIHFWYLSSVILFASLASDIFIDYPSFVSLVNGEYISDDFPASEILAKSVLAFDFIMIMGTIFLLRVSDLKSVIGDKANWAGEIIRGFGYVFILRLIYKLLFTVFGIFNSPDALAKNGLLEESILAVMDQYGTLVAFISVVIVAPVIEEIQFRGVILGSSSKYVPFWMANLIQALLFALVHVNMSLFLFYVAFGLLSGYLRKSTGGYLASFAFHFLNNFFAFLALVFMRW